MIPPAVSGGSRCPCHSNDCCSGVGVVLVLVEGDLDDDGDDDDDDAGSLLLREGIELMVLMDGIAFTRGVVVVIRPIPSTLCYANCLSRYRVHEINTTT